MTLPSRYILDESIENDLIQVEKEVRNDILHKIPDFQDFYLYQIKHIEHLGKYVLQSFRKPIVLICVDTCKKAAKKYNLSMRCVYLTTVLHELGHAIQEARGKSLNEEEAESVAYEYWNYNTLPYWVYNRSK
jgi:hypothetical protein